MMNLFIRMSEQAWSFACTKCEAKVCEEPYFLPCGELFCGSCLATMSPESDDSTLILCPSCHLGFREKPSVCAPAKEFLLHLQTTGNPDEELLSCSICLDTLWKPSILPCGHWLCFWCAEEIRFSVRGDFQAQCPLCRHLYACKPKFSQLLQNYITEQFPEVKNRAEEVKQKEDIAKQVSSTRKTIDSIVEKSLDYLFLNTYLGNGQDQEAFLWVNLGCDGCGVYPMKGPSIYQCLDCMEVVGFDLCRDCYQHRDKDQGASGRYGQHHDPATHEFVELSVTMLLAHLRRQATAEVPSSDPVD